MLVLSPHTSSWTTPGLEVGSVRIEVDALQIGGPEDNLYGLVCRYRDDDNFVFLVASSDGFAGIGAYREGRRELFGGAAMLPAASIAPAGSTNHLLRTVWRTRCGCTSTAAWSPRRSPSAVEPRETSA